MFLKTDIFYLKPTGSLLVPYLIHLKSQHTVVRAIYGLSVAVFGFIPSPIVFEILPIFLQDVSFFGKNSHFAKKSI